MSYQVYKAFFIGQPRDHTAIFGKTNTEDGSGYLFQVKGTIAQGMQYDHKPFHKLDESNTYRNSVEIGTVAQSNFDRIEAVLNTITPPEKQFDEQFKPIDPTESLRRCQERTEEAI